MQREGGGREAEHGPGERGQPAHQAHSCQVH